MGQMCQLKREGERETGGGGGEGGGGVREKRRSRTYVRLANCDGNDGRSAAVIKDDRVEERRLAAR